MTHVTAPSLSLRETRWEPEVEQGGNNSPVSLSKPVNCRDSIILKWSWPWRCMFDINLYTYTYTYVYIYIWLYIYIYTCISLWSTSQTTMNPKSKIPQPLDPWPLGPSWQARVEAKVRRRFTQVTQWGWPTEPTSCSYQFLLRYLWIKHW